MNNKGVQYNAFIPHKEILHKNLIIMYCDGIIPMVKREKAKRKR